MTEYIVSVTDKAKGIEVGKPVFIYADSPADALEIILDTLEALPEAPVVVVDYSTTSAEPVAVVASPAPKVTATPKASK